METNNQRSENFNRSNEPVKQQDNKNKFDQEQKDKNASGKKPVYIKDMPPIDGARPGVI